ncbi:MFS transporter [Arachidicoccus ginsenosidimutans]|uniref:MFS transporter n=1 Tax=Arachidicoccus sp. BS20 TaxID=1850526 RepID=UPI0007F0E5EA|nr:MFS transporter [Arachidicoccus sp. BS20]ANI88390.1 MFS transporter [Arachidicoccus sp. BS20]
MSVTEKVGKFRWTICALLFAATTINYLDRQVLSLLAPSLSKQYHWSNSDYANISGIFQLVYAIALLFAGRFVDKVGTKKGYSWALIIWSLGAMIHALAIPIGTKLSVVLGWIGIAGIPVSVLGFLFGRSVLAIGESGNFPAAIKTTAEYFPKKDRAYATGIFNSGANIGAILAPLTVPWIEKNWGWQSAFIIIGAAGFVWLIFWKIYYEKPEQQKRLSAAELSYINSDDADEIKVVSEKTKVRWAELLKYNQTWSFFIGKFLTDGVWWFFLFWLPKYLNDQYGIKDMQVMLPLAVLYTMTMFGSIFGGWFPIYFIKKTGCKPYDGRMRAMLIIALFPLLVLLAQPLGAYSFWIPVILIGVGASAHQAWSANIFTTVSDMFPKKAVASVTGIGGLAGGVGGYLVTKISGWLFDYYKAQGHLATGYTIVFAFCAIAYLLAWIIMKSLVPKYKLITDL